MTRRSRFRNSRAGSPGGFSLADIRDVVTTATDSLVDAIAGQNPNVDADGFETELRELVTRYGRGGNSAPAGFSAIASAGVPADTRYEYSLAGDLLVAASEYYKAGNFQPFFQTVRDAFRSDDAPKLFAAIAEMNSMTDVEDQAAADDNESDILPDDNFEIDSEFPPADGENEDNFEIYSGGDYADEDDDPLARDPIMADLDDGDHEFRSPSSPMPSGDSDDEPSEVTAEERRKRIAFLNKATLSGSREDRQKVSEAVRRSNRR